MKKRLLLLLVLILSFSLISPSDVLSKGGGRGGKGGKYIGGYGKGGRKGSHYYNPATGNHYQRRGYSLKGYSSGSSFYKYKSPRKYSVPIVYHSSVRRDPKGRIERSELAQKEFLRTFGYADVPLGFEVDHIIPLYAGGADDPSNMQLLTKEQHQAKTKADYQRYGR